MPKYKKVIVAIVVLVGLGTFAKNYNETNHKKMALEKCGSHENIASVDSKGFECKKT